MNTVHTQKNKKNQISIIDYKDVDMLKKYLDPYARILPRKRTGLVARKQRELTIAIKRARFLGLLPFVQK
jgi:small subunit ribosomal protein S18